jgi:hypothetical protein
VLSEEATNNYSCIKTACNLAAKTELGRFPLDYFYKDASYDKL